MQGSVEQTLNRLVGIILVGYIRNAIADRMQPPGERDMRLAAFVPLSILTFAGIAGCASSPPPPTGEFVRAQTLIEQAERNQAQQFAAADLDRARSKLQQSSAAMTAKELDMANRYASEAAVDAELAMARSSLAQAEQSAKEVRASVDELRTESQRGARSP